MIDLSVSMCARVSMGRNKSVFFKESDCFNFICLGTLRRIRFLLIFKCDYYLKSAAHYSYFSIDYGTLFNHPANVLQ